MKTVLIATLIGTIIIVLGYLLIFGLAHAASKRREAWERENKQMWETYDRQRQWETRDKQKKETAEVEALFGSWKDRKDIPNDWPESMRKQWGTYDRQAQWEKLAEICKAKTINDIEQLR